MSKLSQHLSIITENMPSGDFSVATCWFSRGKIHQAYGGEAELFCRELLWRYQEWSLKRGGVLGTQVLEDASYFYFLLPQSHLVAAIDNFTKLLKSEPLSKQQLSGAIHDLLKERKQRRLNRDISLPESLFHPELTEEDSSDLLYKNYLTYRQEVLQPDSLIFSAVGAPSFGDKQEKVGPFCSQVENKALTLKGDVLVATNDACIGVQYPIAIRSSKEFVCWQVFKNLLSLRQDHFILPYIFLGRGGSSLILLSRYFSNKALFPWKEILREARQLLVAPDLEPRWFEAAKRLTEKSFFEESEGVVGRSYVISRSHYYFNGEEPENILKELQSLESKDLVDLLSQVDVKKPNFILGTTDDVSEDFLPVVKDFWQQDDSFDPKMPKYTQVSVATNLQSHFRKGHSCFSIEENIREVKTSLGWRLVHVHKPDLPFDHFGVYFRGGRIFEGPDNCGISQLLLSSVLASSSFHVQGKSVAVAGHRSLSKKLEWLGGYIEADVTADIAGLRGFVLARNFEPVIKPLLHSLFQPAIPADEFVDGIKISLQQLSQRREASLFHRAVDLFYQTVYESHPYGLSRFGGQASLTDLSREDLQAWHKGWIIPSRATFVVASAKPLDQILEMVDAPDIVHPNAIGDARAEVLSLAQYAKGGGQVESFHTHPQKGRGAYVVGFPIPAAIDRMVEHRVDVLQHALVGRGGLLKLSDDCPDLENVRVFYVPLAKGGVFFLYADFLNESAQEVQAYIQDRLYSFTKSALDNEALERAKNFAMGSYQVALQAPMHFIYETARNYLLYNSHERMASYCNALRSVTAEDIQDAANELIQPNRFTNIIVRRNDELG